MTDWVDTTERYIAFVDIMGFSNYVYRNTHNQVKKRMSLLQKIIGKTEIELHEISKTFNKIPNPIKVVIFSDSILLITKDNSKNSLEYILFACQLLLAESFENKIPMKGAVSYGTITADFEKSLFFGKGLIDAYTLQEQLFIYGIVIDEKVEKKIKPYNHLIKGYSVKAKTAMKSGSITHFTINWMIQADKFENNIESNRDKAISIMESFYDDMSGYPRKYIDNTIECIQKIYSQ